MKSALVVAFHHPIEAANAVGPCCICDKTVQMAINGVSEELQIVELAKVKHAKYIGFECMLALFESFHLMLDMPKEELEQVKKELLRKVEKHYAD